MHDKERQWQVWLKELRDKGYSTKNIKETLRKKSYSEEQINWVLKLENTVQKRIIYLIIIIFILLVSAFLLMDYIHKQIPIRSNQRTQDIFTEVMFSNITADKISSEERTLLLEDLENTFNAQCLNLIVHSSVCSPFVIYSYISTRKQLGVPQEEVNTELSQRAINAWKNYYEEIEFDKEGYIVGEDPVTMNSINQFYHFLALLPSTEKEPWFMKVSGVSPTDINLSFDLLKIYRDYFNVFRLSQIPEGMITQEHVENLCYVNHSIEESWSFCEIIYYFQIQLFCEAEITQQELEIAQQKLEIEAQDRVLQACKNGLQKMVSGLKEKNT